MNKKNCCKFGYRRKDVTWFWIELKGGPREFVVARPIHRDAVRAAYGLSVLYDQTIKAA